eukprot:scaffold59154_cov31-Tisochrysis_lutea.AAC.3
MQRSRTAAVLRPSPASRSVPIRPSTCSRRQEPHLSLGGFMQQVEAQQLAGPREIEARRDLTVTTRTPRSVNSPGGWYSPVGVLGGRMKPMAFCTVAIRCSPLRKFAGRSAMREGRSRRSIES